jgi:LysM repeat protein
MKTKPLRRARAPRYYSRVPGRAAPRRTSLIVTLVVVGLVGVALAYLWVQSRNQPLPLAATLTVQSGEAALLRADGTSPLAVKVGETTTLQRGDEVRTNAEGRARLAFSTDETLDLGSKASLIVLELHGAPVTRALVAVLALHEGRVLARIRPALLRETRFEIETVVATVKATGTVFQCDALSKSRLYVAVYEGVVHVSMGERAVDVQAGQAVEARLGQPFTPLVVSQTPPADLARATSPVPVATNVGPDTPPTLTERERTLFPAVLTPTRPGDDAQYYTVQLGDTLNSIARQFGVTYEALLAANKSALPNPNMLKVGQRLRIPKK